MRCYVLVPLRATTLVAVLMMALSVASCGTGNSSAPRTITKTVSAAGPSANASPSTGNGITVVDPNAVGTDQRSEGGDTSAGSGDENTPATPGTRNTPLNTSSNNATQGIEEPSSEATSAPVTSAVTSATGNAVDPLATSCGALLGSRDIDRALGVTVNSGSSRILDVANPDVHMTGRIKCYYGVTEGSDDRPVAVALAQYSTADAAQDQMDVTVGSEKSLGAVASTVEVSGTQAHVLLRNGGFLIVRHDTWTVSIAVEHGLTSNAKLPGALKQLAEMMLARIVKNG